MMILYHICRLMFGTFPRRDAVQWLCKFLHHGEIFPDNLIKIAQTEKISTYDIGSGENLISQISFEWLQLKVVVVVTKAFCRWCTKNFQFACDFTGEATEKCPSTMSSPLSIEIWRNKCHG